MRIKRLIKPEIGDQPVLPIPQRETEGAAGYDLRAAKTLTIAPGERALVPTGFAYEIPHGMVGMVRPRSGLAVRQGLHVMAGVVDSDYRGEVHALLLNTGEKDIEIEHGDRIAQMVVTIHYAGEMIEVDELTNATRGEGGFGSTGKQ